MTRDATTALCLLTLLILRKEDAVIAEEGYLAFRSKALKGFLIKEVRTMATFTGKCVCGNELEKAYNIELGRVFYNCFQCFPMFKRID